MEEYQNLYFTVQFGDLHETSDYLTKMVIWFWGWNQAHKSGVHKPVINARKSFKPHLNTMIHIGRHKGCPICFASANFLEINPKW